MFSKCPNQDLEMVRAWRQYRPDMISRKHCDMESLKDKTLNVSYGPSYPLSMRSKQGEAFGSFPTIIRMAANQLGFTPNFEFQSLWLANGNTSSAGSGIYDKV